MAFQISTRKRKGRKLPITKTNRNKRSANGIALRKSKRTTVSVHDTDISSDDEQESMHSDNELDDEDLDAATSLVTIKTTDGDRIKTVVEVVQRLEQRMKENEETNNRRMQQIEAKLVPNEVIERSGGVSSMTTPSTNNLSFSQLKICKSLVKQKLNDSFFSIKKFLTRKEANDIIEGTETFKNFPITERMVLESINSIRQGSQISARKGYMSKSMHERINGETRRN